MGRRVVIAGGSGFLGRGLVPALEALGYDAVVLTRSVAGAPAAPSVEWVEWDARTLGDWGHVLDGAAALINLVGRSVDCRKTEENKRIILRSRVDSCRVLGEALRRVDEPPPVWVQASTAHIVGDPMPLDTVCDERTPPGPQDEMAPAVGVAWEQAFDEAKLSAQRGVKLRTSFVLGPDGGAAGRLFRLTRAGLGGTAGGGRQGVSWIHQEDFNRIVLAAIEDDAYEGVYMVTAPEPVTNRAFMRSLRRALHRPWSPPAPDFAIRLAARLLMNTDPELALKGRRCVPTRLTEEHGFRFAYPRLDAALADLEAHRRSGRPAGRT